MVSTTEQDARIEAAHEDERSRGFELADPPLMRLTVWRLRDDTYRFTWSMHHILLDGWSSAVLIHEVFTRYQALRKRRAAPAP